MSKIPKKATNATNVPGYTFVAKKGGFTEYTLKSNGLTILHKHVADTGVVTSNITYKVGARDEQAGETGLAHMLEHMLFKPTTFDLKRKVDSGAMQFEREVGCILNANTWKDRTTYFFSYPVEHFATALQVEAERMTSVVLTDKEFLPERGNVLSEFDMYFGDPYFALSVQMVCSAFHSHPYGHETIGFREDIEAYTPAKLDAFYKNYYRPDNATMTIVGDIDLSDALKIMKKQFAHLTNPKTSIPRHEVREPKQEGVRRVSIDRPSTTNVLALGVKHAGFPTQSWFEASMLFSALAGGIDSILHKALVDTGIATSVEGMVEPTGEVNLGMVFVTIAPGHVHADVEKQVLEIIANLNAKDLNKLLHKTIQGALTDEFFAQGSSMRMAMDLTEYVSADAWQEYLDTEKKLKAITPKQLITLSKELFTLDQMTIGYFNGTN
ncbi:MAG: zinc protease [Patiriisocius sp.]|jgi:zinc protease